MLFGNKIDLTSNKVKNNIKPLTCHWKILSLCKSDCVNRVLLLTVRTTSRYKRAAMCQRYRHDLHTRGDRLMSITRERGKPNTDYPTLSSETTASRVPPSATIVDNQSNLYLKSLG